MTWKSAHYIYKSCCGFFITWWLRVWCVSPNALHTISKSIFVGNTWTFNRLCPKDHFCMLGRFFVCSSYLFCKLAHEVAIVHCCNVLKCTGTTRTGQFEDAIISLSAETSMLIMYLSWNICHTVDIWGPIEIPSCRLLSSLVVQWLMFLLLNSGSVVKMDGDRVLLVFWMEKWEVF